MVTTCIIGICDYILCRLQYRESTDYTLLLSCSIEEWERKYGEMYYYMQNTNYYMHVAAYDGGIECYNFHGFAEISEGENLRGLYLI